jgi:prefoldin subunit 5
MNAKRRKEIDAAIKEFEELNSAANELKFIAETLKDTIEQIQCDEQDYFDNMPQSFQDGEKGQRAEEVIGYFDDAINDIDTFIDALDQSIDGIIGTLESAKE